MWRVTKLGCHVLGEGRGCAVDCAVDTDGGSSDVPVVTEKNKKNSQHNNVLRLGTYTLVGPPSSMENLISAL